MVPLLAELAQNGQPIKRREVHIQQNKIVTVGARRRQSLGSVVKCIYLMPSAGKRAGYLLGELGFVFDEKNAHKVRSSSSRKVTGLLIESEPYGDWRLFR